MLVYQRVYVYYLYLILAPGQVPAGGPGEMGCVIGGMLSGARHHNTTQLYIYISKMNMEVYILLYIR